MQLTVFFSTAIVTLYPIFIPDAFPFRSLNFTSDNDYYDVGRSSKREAKNLSPARDNALFDSRVMSRDHARIRVSMEKKVRGYIYIPGG